MRLACRCCGLLCVSFLLLTLLGCGNQEKYSETDQSINQHGGESAEVVTTRHAEASHITYGYDGQLGRYGIADNAAAYDGATLLAKAKAIKVIEKNPGPNQLEVEETHFSATGKVTYRGLLRFRFSGDGAYVEEEMPISGQKEESYFSGWPSGR